MEAVARPRWSASSASYTYLDAVVTQVVRERRAQPGDQPGVPGHPDRRVFAAGRRAAVPPSGQLRQPVGHATQRARRRSALAGYFAGKRDDSTFLSDGYFGNSMLLPNKDLDAAYQKVDLSGSYRIVPRLRWYVSVENLFDQSYNATFGFPALPRGARTGVTVTFGGR